MTICAPVDCCCQPWSIARGDVSALRIDWGPWVASQPGFVGINEIVECYLLDINVPPPHPYADPYEIALVSGYDVPPAYGPPGFANIISPTITEVLVEASDGVPIGRTYRLNMKVRAHDCNGRKVTTTDCVFIYITQC
jgi:hypothetical protein